MSELIDTTEMYLRIFFELQEEGVPLLRARIVERLHQSGPTVSQTVGRMERDGLVEVLSDRRVRLTDTGAVLAARVMRKHRLVERLLVDVIGLDWELVHDEACRWEHVVSEDVERKIVRMIEPPYVSPYGNPIPLLEELGEQTVPYADSTVLSDLVDIARAVRVCRMCEHLQDDKELLAELQAAKVLPGAKLVLGRDAKGNLLVNGKTIPADSLEHIHTIPMGV